jgi:hypothetical protein
MPRLAVVTFNRQFALEMSRRFDGGRPPHESPESALDAETIALIEAADAERS